MSPCDPTEIRDRFEIDPPFGPNCGVLWQQDLSHFLSQSVVTHHGYFRKLDKIRAKLLDGIIKMVRSWIDV
jgi:hypothetical protein